MSQFDLKKKVITGVEGLIAQSEERINALSKEAYIEWLDVIYKTSINPITWGSCEHFLYIGEKNNRIRYELEEYLWRKCQLGGQLMKMRKN